MSNALTSRRQLLRRPKVCLSIPTHELPVNIPSTGDCIHLDPAPLEYEFSLSGLTNNICSNCDSLNATWIVTHTTGCVWRKNVDGICSGAVAIRLELTATLARLTFIAELEFEERYEGALPTQLADQIQLTQVSSSPFCDNFPTTLTLTPVPE